MTVDERGQLEAVLGHRFEHSDRLERALAKTLNWAKSEKLL